MRPWTYLLAAVAGWMNRRQQEVIEYLKEENRVLREHVGRKRLLLTDEQKRRLATKGKTLGRRRLEQFGTLFSPDTILKWHRMFVARKYDGSDRRGGRGPVPRKANSIRKLVLRMVGDNPSWGYRGAWTFVAACSECWRRKGCEKAKRRKRLRIVR